MRITSVGAPTERLGATASQLWEPPPEFDGYRLLRLLGEGASGKVYLANDTVLERAVALKFLDPDGINPQRFMTEARAIARLQHPNVVAIYRVGEVAGRPYLVSEFVRGQPLDQIARPVSMERALHIGLGLARGLAAAHRRGVLHRDVKPANAILADEGEVKLLDFGLAKLIESPKQSEVLSSLDAEDAKIPSQSTGSPARLDITRLDESSSSSPTVRPLAEVTAPGTIFGTPLYTSPEVWAGRPATPQSDVYSLGALLYQLSSGHLPHEAHDLTALSQRVQSNEPLPLMQRTQGLDPQFAAVVDRCLQRDPALRFKTADEVRDALEQISPVSRGTVIPEGNAFRGLMPFEAHHRALFFGRDSDIRAVLERLRTETFVLVCGGSGVGKSSLCRAGILPRVVEGALADGRAWTVASVAPGRNALQALASALAAALSQDAEAMARRLLDDPADLIRELTKRLGSRAGLLVFIDQLEEVLTLNPPERASAVADVLHWLSIESPAIRLLATLRGDFFTALASLPSIGAEASRAFHLLRLLSQNGIRESIVGPARARGFSFESEAIVDELVESTSRAEGGLPLLQFTLAQLWEARDEARRLIPSAALKSLGGVSGALARHGDAVLSGLAPPQRSAARRLLCQLVTSGGTRACRTHEEIVGTDSVAADALNSLIHGRLVVARDSEEGSAYELAHEVLIRGWSTLQRWLHQDVDQKAARERLERAAADWDRLGRLGSALWGPPQLSEITGLDASLFNPRESDFVAASKRAISRRRFIRRGSVLGVAALTALVYGAVQLKVRYEVAERVSRHLLEARSALDQARTLNLAVQASQERAFTAFDNQRRDEGELLWAQGLAQAGEVESTYGLASKPLATAFAIDPRGKETRAMLAELFYERALIAERDHQPKRRDELLENLSLYDDNAQHRRRWDAVGRLSVTTIPPGAQVWLERFDETSPRRTIRERGELRSTPFHGVEVPQGSFILRFKLLGRAEVRYPLLVRRSEQVELNLYLPGSSEVPDGFVYIPPGKFLYGSANEGLRRAFYNTSPTHEMKTKGYFIQQTETTYADWISFLESLPLPERDRRLPRVFGGSFHGGLELKRLANEWQFTFHPGALTYVARSAEKIIYRERLKRLEHNWMRFPVSGITAGDAQAFLNWLHRSGRVPGARLCTEYEWERAARGADDREYPHGDLLEPDDANYDETYGRNPRAMGLDEVGAHPLSRSPFGVDDLAGNVWEYVRSVTSTDPCLARGGSFYMNPVASRSVNRQPIECTLRDTNAGLRVCATPVSAMATETH